MHAYRIVVTAAIAALGWAGAAAAAPCYVVLDKNDVVVYRDFSPPFDLSVKDSSERAVMRQRGWHLIIAEFEKCETVSYSKSTTGAGYATVDEIVMSLQPAISTSIGNGGSYVTDSRTAKGGY